MTEICEQGDVNGDDFVPPAEELERLYIMLGEGKIPELEWQFPGRRSPSPENAVKTEAKGTQNADNTEESEPAKNDFDFDDDVAQPQLRVRSQNTPKSKKKMANFAGVMEVLKKKNAEGSN